ncbi:MAG: hypothetical protein H0U70_05680 [Tatlockia sp.]|nr:hypothetical protein [Tatlockia sp.]
MFNDFIKTMIIGIFVAPVLMAILALTGKITALIAAFSIPGFALICMGITFSVGGLVTGINLLVNGELGKGALYTISSGTALGALIGALIGILLPGIGTVIGPLAGAGIGLLASLVPVAIACFYDYFKELVKIENTTNKNNFSEQFRPVKELQSDMTVQPTPGQAFFEFRTASHLPSKTNNKNKIEMTELTDRTQVESSTGYAP